MTIPCTMAFLMGSCTGRRAACYTAARPVAGEPALPPSMPLLTLPARSGNILFQTSPEDWA